MNAGDSRFDVFEFEDCQSPSRGCWRYFGNSGGALPGYWREVSALISPDFTRFETNLHASSGSGRLPFER